MNKPCILLDLDGTITDPKAGITKSVAYALESFGIHVDDLDTLTPFIGPPLGESFKRFYSLSDAQAQQAIAKYREYFAPTGMYENTLYTGMDSLLRRQREAGRHLVLATSKPTVYAEAILKHFDLHRYFNFVAGSELDGRRSAKSEVIRYALAGAGITDLQSAVMIGDREHDIMGARTVGLDSIGVLYGYGSRDELVAAGATYIAEDVGALARLLEA